MNSKAPNMRRSSVAVSLLLLVGGCSGEETKGGTTLLVGAELAASELPANNSVIDVANSKGNAEIVAAAASGQMMDLLGDTSAEFTLLVPTDAALKALYAAHPDYRDDEGRASFLLKMHLIKGSYDAKQLRALAGKTVSMTSGIDLDVRLEGDVLKVGWVTVGDDLSTAVNGNLISVEGVMAPELAPK